MRISELAQAVQQPSPDAGAFADVYGKVAGVVAWGVPAISVLMIIGLGVWFGYAYMDPSQDETKPKKVLLWSVVGGAIASGAATIVNWAYGSG